MSVATREDYARRHSVFLLFSCSLQEGPPTRGIPVTFEAVCSKANAGKRVTGDGIRAIRFTPAVGMETRLVSLTQRRLIESITVKTELP